MESESEIVWEAERVELKSELSRLEEELMDSRAETEELRCRTNVLTERLSQKLDSSISLHWESDQREWRKKLREGKERESRQALLIRKLQQKVMEYRSRCEQLQQHMMTEEREKRVRERILLDERSNNLETTLIRLEEEHQRSATMAEVNSLLRIQLSQSSEENQTLQDELKKLTADWSKAVEEAQQKEVDWSKEKEVFSGYLEAERSRLMTLWSRVVDLRRQCHAVKVATDKDLWELRAEFTRLSSPFLSLNIFPATSSHIPPTPPTLCYTSGPMTLAELDHEENMKNLKSRLDDLTAILKSQELERQRKDEAIKSRNIKEEKEQEVLQEKCREMERKLESVTQAIRKLYRVLDSQKTDGQTRCLPNGVLSNDLHYILWVISEAEGAFQWGHKELQEAEGKWHRLKVESESLEHQITELKTEREDLQKQASLEALELKEMKNLLRNEMETTLSLKMQLDESEQRSEDLKKENVRLIEERARMDEERSGIETERQKQLEAELLENANLFEQQSRTRTELHTLQVALEQERLEKARAEKELADCRQALDKTRELLLTLSATHNLLQRETADMTDSLGKMSSLNESLAQDKREISARNLQLEVEVTEAQLQLQCFRSDVASLEKELNAVSEENTELRASRNEDLHSLHLLRGKEQELEGELQVLIEEKESIVISLTEEERKNEKLCEQYRNVNEELDTVKLKLQTLMDQVKKTQRENEQLQKENQSLEKQVNSMGQEKEEIQQDCEELRKLSGNLQQQLCVAKEQISVLEVQHSQSQTQIHTLQLAKDVLHGEIKCLQSEVESNSILREEARRGALEEHIQREKEIEIFQLEIRRLNAEAQTLLKNHTIHEEDRTKWQIEREALNAELGLKDGEMGALKNRMDGLVKENEKLAALIGEKDGNVERVSSEIRMLELQMREAKAEIEQYREKVKAIEREKEAILEQVKEDREDLQKIKKQNATVGDILHMRDCEIEKKSKHIEELITSIRLQDTLIENLKLELNEKEIVLSDQINNEKIKQKDWEAEGTEKCVKLKGELKKKDYEIEILSDNVKELKVQKQHISHLVHERDTSIEKLKNKVKAMEQTYKERQDEVEWWKKKAGDVSGENEVLMKTVDKHIFVEQERDELADQLRERDREIKRLKKKEHELVHDHERMVEEYEKHKTELRQRDRELEENRITILKLSNEKDDNEKLKKEKISLEEKKNQLQDGEQKMKEEIYFLKKKIGTLDRESLEVERNTLEHKNKLQIQTFLLNEREEDIKRLTYILEQKEQQLMMIQERLTETELCLEEKRNLQKDYNQKLLLESDKLKKIQDKVKELEVKNNNLIEEADVMRIKLGEQLKDLETKSKLLQESEGNVRRFKLSIESGEEEKEKLQCLLDETQAEMERLKIKLNERRGEEMLKMELKQQIHDLEENLRRKDKVIDAIKEKTDFIIKQKEEELKQAKEDLETMSTEVTKLRKDLTILSLINKKAETMVKEQDLENKKMKDGLKAGLEEMATLKLLLEESHCEGEKIRKVLEEKKKEIIMGLNVEVNPVREEIGYLKQRVQTLQKDNQELQSQLNKFKLVSEQLEEENDMTSMRNTWEEQDYAMLKCALEKKNTVIELVKGNFGETRKTDTLKKEMKESEKRKHVEVENVKKITFATENENARHVSGEQLKNTQTETDIFKRKMKSETQHVMTNLEDNILMKTDSQFLENCSTVNPRDFKMKELHSPATATENPQLQTNVYDINEEADKLRKNRDGLITALENNDEMLIQYQEKAHQLEIKMASVFEEESQGRMCALQRAVAELELNVIKFQQRNERLEHRIKKLKLEKTNLREALKQFVLEREKMRCQLSQTDAEIQDCSHPSGADELNRLRTQLHQLRLALTCDHEKWADFIHQSLRNSNSLQTLRQDLNDSLTLVSKQLAPSVLEYETQRLDNSLREELRNFLTHNS